MNERLETARATLKRARELATRRSSINTPHSLKPGLTDAAVDQLIDVLDILAVEVEQLDGWGARVNDALAAIKNYLQKLTEHLT